MDPSEDFMRYLQQKMYEGMPTVKSWAEEHMKMPQSVHDDAPGWWQDSAQQMTRDVNVTRDPRINKGVEPVLRDWAQVMNGDEMQANALRAKIMGNWRSMDWAQNIAGDVGNRANAVTGVGDLISGMTLRQMAHGDAMDPMANFARYLLGQQSDPNVRL